MSIDSFFLNERYRVESLIDSSALVSVYKAHHLTLDKTVVIKVLNAAQSISQKSLQRFELEATHASQVNHANVVKIIDFGLKPVPFMVMEYIPGITLKSLLAERGKLQIDLCLSVCLQILDALSAVHKCGLVHRDLKPGNIMVDFLGSGKVHVTLIDFGIAKEIHSLDSLDLTRTDSLIGTLPYISPEQCSGTSLDERSDIYSFGCVAYEALQGKRVFASINPFDWVRAHTSEIPTFKTHRSDKKHRKWFYTVILKCLEKSPAHRYSTVEALQNDLRQIQNGKAPDAVRQSKKTLSAHRAERFKLSWRLYFAISIAISVVLIVAGSWHQRSALINFLWHYDYDEGMRKLKSGDSSSAEQKFREAADLGAFFGTSDFRYLSSLSRLVELFDKENNIREATLLRSRITTLSGNATVEWSQNMHQGLAESERGNFEQAKYLTRRALNISQMESNFCLTAAKAHRQLGYISLCEGQLTVAERETREALSIEEQILDRRSIETAQSLNQLGIIYLSKKSPQSSILVFESVGEITKKCYPDNSQEWMPALFNLGIAQSASGNSDNAIQYLLDGLAIARIDEGINRLYLALFSDELARLYAEKGQSKQAYDLLKRSIDVLDVERGTDFFKASLQCARTFVLLPRL